VHHSTRFTLTLVTFAALCRGEAYAPPAQGPPPAPAGVLLREISVSLVTARLKSTVEQKLVEMNASLRLRTDARAKVSLQNVQVWAPRMTQTLFTDRPNHRYVEIPYMIEFKVSDIQWAKSVTTIERPCTAPDSPPGCVETATVVNWGDYPFSRKLTMSVYANAFCNGWELGSGHIQIAAAPERPYLDPDPGFLEAFVNFFLNGHLVEFVNSKLRQALVTPGGFSQTLAESKCDTLQRFTGDANSLADDNIQWSEPSGFQPPHTTPRLTVRPTRVKRLQARAFDITSGGSSVLYYPVESPGLDFWAGFTHWYVQLPSMTENQEILLAEPALAVIPRLPGPTSLVVIASTVHSHTTDGNFALFTAPNYGHGTRKIVINKTYFQTSRNTLKPTKMIVQGYEVTFEVFNPFPDTVLGFTF
jgi:hypothetical protein